MKLLEGAYDGDIEGVRSVMSTGVPLDVIYPVRLFIIIESVDSICRDGTDTPISLNK